MKLRFIALAIISLSSSASYAAYTCTTHSGDDRVFTGRDADQNIAQRKAAEACDNGGRTSRRQCYGNVSCNFDGGFNPGPGPRPFPPRPFPPRPRHEYWYCETSSGNRVFSAQSNDRNTAQLQAAQACDNGGRTSRRQCYGNVRCEMRGGWGW
jgi:hypothetical protein